MFSNKLLILTYHRVLGPEHRQDADQVDRDQFDMHVGMLSRYFNVLTLADAVDAVARRELPSRAVAITFDDGYRDNVTVALPVLERHGVAASFFIATGYLDGGIMFNDIVIESIMRCDADVAELSPLRLGRHPLATQSDRNNAIASLLGELKYRPEDERTDMARKIADHLQIDIPTDLMMNTEDLLHLRDAGMEIGGHTRSHPILAATPDGAAFDNICQGKADIEAITGVPVTSFAYPNGRPGQDFEARHASMVRDAGFVRAVTTAAACVTADTDSYQLGRFSVWHRSRPKLLLRILLNYFADSQVTVQ